MAVLSIGDRRLGAILLEQGYVSDDDLQKALERHAEIGGRLSDILIDSNLVTERRIARAVEEALGIPLVNLTAVKIPPEVLALVDAETAQSYGAIPYGLDAPQMLLRVAFVDPLNALAVESIEDATGYTVEPYQALRDHVQWALATCYPELGLEVPKLEDLNDPQHEQLGRKLLRRGLLNERQLDEALALQKQSGDALGETLVGLGIITQEQLFEVLAEQAGVPFIRNPRDYNPPEDILGLMLRGDALRMQAVPLEDQAGTLLMAATDFRRAEDLEKVVGRPVKVALITPTALDNLIERFYPEKGRLGEALVREGALGRDQLREALQVQRKAGKSKPLGEVLIELGYAPAEEVERALAKQRAGGGRLEDTLVQSGKISPEMLARSLAVQLGYEYINPAETPPDVGVINMIPEATARRYTLFPMRLQGKSLVVAMKDPRHVFAIDDLRLMTGREIIPAVASEKDIVKLIERYHGASDMAALNKELAAATKSKVEKEDAQIDLLDDNAVVRVVDTIIREAALAEASDIHIEPSAEKVTVRFRVDGALREHMELPKSAAPSIAARVKILGQLDIAERRVPQDGRLRFKKGTVDLDLRLSTLPTVYGEKIVMRLLQKASNIPEIEDLGFSPHNFQRFYDTIQKPYGIFLITGPTGSGKSFTTFSILKRISRPEKNTTTVEDPVEYEIPGINQTQVNNQAGLTFARALRSFLRQDPDIIMVGEIRDAETAKIATEAALTGHLVIATLHTNDAAGAVTRLEEMGVENFNISASLIGVLAQRLVRRVCANCKTEVSADPEVLRRLGISEHDVRDAKLYKGAGCERCNGSGYKGRMAIHELLVIDGPVRAAINAGKAATEIKDVAELHSGLRTLRADGLEKALQGMTTLEEILGSTST
ncbi:type IV pilus assembly protein PilB [Deinobacterium chartae]|uniref:Type IV pilus assembly protein PilB n=1 Tax=Deinobacterium chartae TaxID=521158 RepID=A0A841I3L5_9DEIO|nr:type II/IV secretion system protein [Deinobacterium chartae]MBB6098919.1 type IV pilus assembly protein PilB [Deinobacterium chartae]